MLRFASGMADGSARSDGAALIEGLRHHFDDGQIVELALVCAVLAGVDTMEEALGLK